MQWLCKAEYHRIVNDGAIRLRELHFSSVFSAFDVVVGLLLSTVNCTPVGGSEQVGYLIFFLIFLLLLNLFDVACPGYIVSL